MKEPFFTKAMNYLRSIKFGIVFGNVAILLMTTLFIIIYSQHNNYNILINNTQSFMKISGRNILENIEDEFKKIETILKMTASVVESIQENCEPPVYAIQTIGPALDSNPSIASIFFGLKNDYFASILRKNENDKYRTNAEKKLPPSSQYAWKIIDNIANKEKTNQQERIEKWFYFDKHGAVLGSEIVEGSSFYPTKRPWFKINEKDISWTDVYVFTGSIQEPGITASIALSDIQDEEKKKGVLAIDVTLSSLKDILINSKTIASSKLYLINDADKIVSSTEKLEFNTVDGKVEFPSINQPEFEVIKKILAQKYIGKEAIYFQEKDYHVLAHVSEFKVGGNQWSLVNITPDSEFLDVIFQLQFNTFVKCLFMVTLAAIIMFVFARSISGKISKLSINARKIENFELDKIESVHSKVVEIQQLSHSMDAMNRSMDSFSKYVPKDLVLKLMRENTNIDLGGELREISLFFSDIEGFTTISEKVKPKELLEQVTDYFTVLTDIMTKQQGTIDKFIGDAIMAFWGAPDAMVNHPQRACHTALQIQRILHMKNSDWINLGLYPFVTRIGIHTATVLVGNIGSKTRLNYTAIGDDVNLCARLEGLNKYYKTNIMISGDTYAKISGDFFARPLGKVAVKGKKTNVPIYELMGAFKHIDTALLLSPQAVRDYEKYLVAYDYIEQKRFSSALEILEDIQIKDGPVTMMMDVCIKYQKTPPKDDWEGLVQSMDAK